jgi:hypothetical protein
MNSAYVMRLSEKGLGCPLSPETVPEDVKPTLTVPPVYLTSANPVFLAFFSFNRISNLRVFNVAFSSIPTAPANQLS